MTSHTLKSLLGCWYSTIQESWRKCEGIDYSQSYECRRCPILKYPGIAWMASLLRSLIWNFLRLGKIYWFQWLFHHCLVPLQCRGVVQIIYARPFRVLNVPSSQSSHSCNLLRSNWGHHYLSERKQIESPIPLRRCNPLQSDLSRLLLRTKCPDTLTTWICFALWRQLLKSCLGCSNKLPGPTCSLSCHL